MKNLSYRENAKKKKSGGGGGRLDVNKELNLF